MKDIIKLFYVKGALKIKAIVRIKCKPGLCLGSNKGRRSSIDNFHHSTTLSAIGTPSYIIGKYLVPVLLLLINLQFRFIC